MNQENDSQDLEKIFNSIENLSKKIDEQNVRISNLEKINYANQKTSKFYEVEMSGATSAPMPPPPPPPPPSPTSMRQVSDDHENVETLREKMLDIPPRKEIDMEENIGVKWFSRIGMTALVLGISFFLKYAFDNDWIGEVGRVVIGIGAGAILLALGEKFIRKYEVSGQILSGGGIAVLYLSIFSAFNFYHLIGHVPAFFVMILVTLVGIVLSLRYDSLSLILVSILGGFATPFLLSNGQNNALGLFSYILLLDLLILVVSFHKKWRLLNVIGFFGTILVVALWSSQFYTSSQLFITQFFITIFFLVYSLSSLIYNLNKKENSTGIEQLLILASAFVYFGASYALLDPKYHIFMGFFALLLGVYYFLWAYVIRAITPEDNNLYGFLAFLTVGFVTLAVPIQFEQKFITFAWLVEAAILITLGVKMKQNSIKIFGIVVFGLTLFRLFFFDAEYDLDALVIFNKTFAIFMATIITAYVLAFFMRYLRDENEEDGSVVYSAGVLIPLFIIVANVLTVFIGTREIGLYYDSQIRILQKASNPPVLQGGIRSNNDEFYAIANANREKIGKIRNKNSVTLSIFWLLYGIILLVVGISGKYKKVRIGGLVLLTLAIFKLFFIDLWNLGTLYRIISSISLGVVLLGISFSYQKFKDKIKEII
jgi:uncharacterized membrane protein